MLSLEVAVGPADGELSLGESEGATGEDIAAEDVI